MLRPVVEPIKGAAVDQRWESPASHPKLLTNRAHTKHDVEVVSNSFKVSFVYSFPGFRSFKHLIDLREGIGHALIIFFCIC